MVDNIHECTQWPPPNTSIEAKDEKSKTNQNVLHQHNLNLKEKQGMNVRRWQRNRFYFNFTEIGSLCILRRVCCIFLMSTDEIEHFFIGHSIDIGLWRWRLMSDWKRNTRNEFAFCTICCLLCAPRKTLKQNIKIICHSHDVRHSNYNYMQLLLYCSRSKWKCLCRCVWVWAMSSRQHVAEQEAWQ